MDALPGPFPQPAVKKTSVPEARTDARAEAVLPRGPPVLLRGELLLQGQADFLERQAVVRERLAHRREAVQPEPLLRRHRVLLSRSRSRVWMRLGPRFHKPASSCVPVVRPVTAAPCERAKSSRRLWNHDRGSHPCRRRQGGAPCSTCFGAATGTAGEPRTCGSRTWRRSPPPPRRGVRASG